MEVRWSLSAAEDLELICQRIERDNPEQPGASLERFMTDALGSGIYPILGRLSLRMAERRELTFSPIPYLWFIK